MIIKIEKTRNPKQVTITFLSEANSILQELELSEKNYLRVQFSNFTEKDISKYNELSEKIKINIQAIL